MCESYLVDAAWCSQLSPKSEKKGVSQNWGYQYGGPHTKDYSILAVYMGGCQNYGPFLGPYYNMAPNI